MRKCLKRTHRGRVVARHLEIGNVVNVTWRESNV